MNLAGTWNGFSGTRGLLGWYIVRRVGFADSTFNVIMCLFLGLGCLIKHYSMKDRPTCRCSAGFRSVVDWTPAGAVKTVHILNDRKWRLPARSLGSIAAAGTGIRAHWQAAQHGQDGRQNREGPPIGSEMKLSRRKKIMVLQITEKFILRIRFYTEAPGSGSGLHWQWQAWVPLVGADWMPIRGIYTRGCVG